MIARVKLTLKGRTGEVTVERAFRQPVDGVRLTRTEDQFFEDLRADLLRALDEAQQAYRAAKRKAA